MIGYTSNKVIATLKGGVIVGCILINNLAVQGIGGLFEQLFYCDW